MADINPFIGIKVQVPSSPTHTIYLINFDTEEGRTSPVPVIEEVYNGNNLQEFMNLFSSNKRKSSSVPKNP